jgi:putative inorganic carbon (HCO3(-)) transporter
MTAVGTYEAEDAAGADQGGEPWGARPPAFVWVFLAGLVFNLGSGNAQLFGLPLSPDRPLFVLAAILLLLDPRRPVLRWAPVLFVMAATVGWTGWSWLATGYVRDSFKAFALSDRIAMPFLMFVLGPLIFSSASRRDLLLKVMVVIGVYLGLTALFETMHMTALIFPGAIADPALGIGYGRARGPFLSAEPMGMACGLCFFLSATAVWRFRGGWRFAAACASVLSLVGVLLCLTRSTWLGAGLAMVAVAVVVPRLRIWLPVVVGFVVAVVVFIHAALPDVYANIVDRLTTQRSIYDRLNTNAAAVRIIQAYPVHGIGWGRFLEVSGDWVRQADTYPVTSTRIEVHNVFLARAAETGVPGALGWALAMLLGPVAAVLQRARTAELRAWQVLALAAVIIWLIPTLSSPNPYPFPNNLVWLIGGIAAGPLLVRPRGVDDIKSGRSQTRG